jgi:hypothetical protein
MYHKFKSKCDFISIYILEAHAMDEWPIRTKSNLCIKQHQTLHDRCIMAKSLIHDYKFNMPIYVDTMENSFENTYAAWPLRVFIIQNNQIQFILEPRLPGYYDFQDLYSELTRRF